MLIIKFLMSVAEHAEKSHGFLSSDPVFTALEAAKI